MTTKVPGANRLRNARAVIEDENCARDALLEAAGEFWSATFDSDEWPIELQARALPARFMLVRHGSFEDTVRHLGDADLRRLCRELVEIAEMADRIERRSA